MPDNGHIGDLVHDAVTVDPLTATPRAVLATFGEQVAVHHRDIAVDGGVGDRHPNSTVRMVVSAITTGNDLGSDTGLPGR